MSKGNKNTQSKARSWKDLAPKAHAANSDQASNQSSQGDHFAQLSQRFWSFAKAPFANQGQDRTLSDIMIDIWRARMSMALGMLCALGVAILILLATVPATPASMLLAPAKQLSDQNRAAINGNSIDMLRSLAQQAGGDISSDFTRFKAIYNGGAVAKILLDDPQIMQGINLDKRFIWGGFKGNWTPERLADYLQNHVRLAPVGVTGIYKLSYWHPSPEFAQFFLARLHGVSDQIVRASVQEGAYQRRDYLNNQIAQPAHPQHKRILTDLLLEQERLIMLSAIDQPYAASIIEMPSAHYKSLWPPKALFILLAIFIGGFIGYLIHYMRYGRDA